MKKTLILSLILLLATGLFAERKALVLGNAAYRNNLLSAPINDALAMRSTLEGLGFETSYAVDLGLKEMTAVVDTFCTRLGPEDEVIFYYSGFGAHGSGSANYLLPVDADPSVTDFYDYPAVSLHVNELLKKLSRAKSSVAILEASRIWTTDKGEKLRLSFVWEGVENENQMLATSTGPDRLIPDQNLNESVFTQALLERLNSPPASINTIFEELSEELPKLTDGKYHPWFSGLLKDDLLLYPALPLSLPAAPTPSEVEGGGSLSW